MSLKIRFLNHWRNHAIVYQLVLILGGMGAVIGGFFLTVKFLQRTSEAGYVAQEQLTEEEILAYSTRPEEQIFDKPDNGERLGLQAVIRRALRAHGGVQKLAEIQTLRRAGQVTLHDVEQAGTVKSTVIYRSPDRIRYMYETKDYTMTAGTNGKDFWQRIELDRGDVLFDRMGALEQIFVEIDLVSVVPFNDALWREGDLTLLPSPEGDADAPYVIERRTDRFIDQITIDSGHFLCTQRDIRFEPVDDRSQGRVTITYADYRYVEGVALPFFISTFQDGRKSNSVQLSAVEINPGVLSYVFEPPQPLPPVATAE